MSLSQLYILQKDCFPAEHMRKTIAVYIERFVIPKEKKTLITFLVKRGQERFEPSFPS